MRGLRILTVRGIPIILHWTFLVLIGLAPFALQAGGVMPFWHAAILMGIVFATVALHELAHAVAAQRYRIRTRAITLFPIGGVASMERIPENPRQEAVIAAAGPALNVVLGAAVFAFIYFLPGIVFIVAPFSLLLNDVVANPDLFTRSVVLLYKINFALAAFNLIPAFPMDGGRLLRAALVAAGQPYPAATTQAVRVAKAFLVLFVILGLWAPVLWFIALFLWMGATAEERFVRARHALSNLRAGHLLPQDLLALEPTTELAELVPYLARDGQRHFPVVSRGRLVGLLCGPDLAAALAAPGGADRRAGDLMRSPLTVDARDPLHEVSQRLDEAAAPAAVILDRGRLAGLVSREALQILARQLDPALES